MNLSFSTPRGSGVSPVSSSFQFTGAKALIGSLVLILGYGSIPAAFAESANSASVANPNAASSANVNGSNKAKQLPAPADEAAIAARARAFDEAKSLMEHGNLAGAENRLTDQNAPQSAESHREIANRLAALAGAMARENNPEAVSALAARALQHLNDAHGLASDAHSKSRIKAHAGWIQENLIGDVPSAIASYKAAVELSSNNKAAKEALARLTAMDANLRAKIQATRQ